MLESSFKIDVLNHGGVEICCRCGYCCQHFCCFCQAASEEERLGGGRTAGRVASGPSVEQHSRWSARLRHAGQDHTLLFNDFNYLHVSRYALGGGTLLHSMLSSPCVSPGARSLPGGYFRSHRRDAGGSCESRTGMFNVSRLRCASRW